MTDLILVRHGESEANGARRFAASGDVPLTSAGRTQSVDAARRIAARFKPVGVVSSVFVRARQTAEIISGHLRLPFETVRNFHERDLGVLKGETFDAYFATAHYDAAFDPTREWAWRPPGGESRDDLRLRVIPVLEGLARRYPDDALVVVSHGAVMRSIWAHATGRWDDAHHPPNCGIVLLGYEDGRFGAPVIVDGE